MDGGLLGEAFEGAHLAAVALEGGGTGDVGGHELVEGFDAFDVSAFVAVAGIDGEAEESGAEVVACFHGGGDIAAVVTEDIAAVFDGVVVCKVDELVGEMVVEGSGHVAHGDGDAVIAGGGFRCVGGVVDGDHFGDIALKNGGGAAADFLEDGEKNAGVDGGGDVELSDVAGEGEEGGDADFVVEVAGVDEAVVEFGVAVEGDEVAGLDAEGLEVFGGVRGLVDAEFDLVPVDRLGVDFLVVDVA